MLRQRVLHVTFFESLALVLFQFGAPTCGWQSVGNSWSFVTSSPCKKLTSLCSTRLVMSNTWKEAQKKRDAAKVLQMMEEKRWKNDVCWALSRGPTLTSTADVQAFSLVSRRAINLKGINDWPDIEILRQLAERQFGKTQGKRIRVAAVLGIVSSPFSRTVSGAGRALLQHIIRWAHAKKLLVVLGPLNKELTAYYSSFGFRELRLGIQEIPEMVYAGDIPESDMQIGSPIVKVKVKMFESIVQSWLVKYSMDLVVLHKTAALDGKVVEQDSEVEEDSEVFIDHPQ